MAISKEDAIKELQNRDMVYVAYSQFTKLPYVKCDEETFNDQAWIFSTVEGIKEFGKKLLDDKVLLMGMRYEKKDYPRLYGTFYAIGVNTVMWVDGEEPIDMMEINISCPNVNAGFLAFGQDARHVEELTAQIKKIAKQPVIMKLTPNVTDITEIAKGAEAGGADAVSLINTLTGMKIDINRKTFALANKTGGVSGPIVKPVAVRMVYQVARAVKIPIIGMGGISCAEDAIEFILAGASAVSVGTANFHNPAVTMEVIDGIEAYMKKNGFESVKDMVGIVK